MTKYILVGGADRKYPVYGQELAAEVGRTLHNPPKILSCFFAEPAELWDEKFKFRVGWFKNIFGTATEVVLATPSQFSEQVAWADIIYLHGGEDDNLNGHLDKIPGLAKLWDGKIVVGSSAGADYLAKKYWTCDLRSVGVGSGITNLNVIPHFESDEYGMDDSRGPIDWEAARQELEQSLSPDETVTPLREGKFVVVEQ